MLVRRGRELGSCPRLDQWSRSPVTGAVALRSAFLLHGALQTKSPKQAVIEASQAILVVAMITARSSILGAGSPGRQIWVDQQAFDVSTDSSSRVLATPPQGHERNRPVGPRASGRRAITLSPIAVKASCRD